MASDKQDTYRLGFDVDDDGIRSVSSTLDEVEEHAHDAESAVNGLGVRVNGLGDDAQKLGATWKDVGTALGAKFTKPFGDFFKGAKSKIGTFGKDFKSGFQTVSNSARHPIQTLRDGLYGALTRVRDGTQDVVEGAKEIGDAAKSAGEKGADGFGKLANVLKVVVAGELAKKVFAGIGKAAVAGIEKVGDIQRSVSSLSATLGKEGGAAVSKWADEYANAAGRSRAEVKGFLADNAAMVNQLGVRGKAAQEMAQTTTALGYDMAAAFNVKDDAEMMSSLNAAIGGATDALSQYGVKLDDSTLKRTALSMGLKGEISDLSDAQAAQVRYQSILDQTKDAQLGVFNASGNLTNGLKGIKAIGANLLQTVGEKAAPIVGKLMGTIQNLMPKVEPIIGRVVDLLSDGLADALPVVADLAEELLPALADTVGSLFTSLAPLIPVAVELFKKLLPPALNVISTLAEKLLPPLVGVISVLIPPIAEIAEQILPPLLDLASELLPPLGELVSQMLPPIVDIAMTLIPPISNIVKSLLPPFAKIIQAVLPGLTKIADAILPPTLTLVEALLPAIEALTPVITLVGNVIAKVAEGVASIAGGIAKFGGKLINGIAGLFGGGKDDAPHNATGTPFFGGGWTHINEQGGEMAFLPQGSAIIPADKSQQVAEALTAGVSSKSGKNVVYNITVPITIQGNADQGVLQQVEALVKAAVERALDEASQKATHDEMIQEGYALPA